MATKPDPVNDLPPAWGGAGNYPLSQYALTLPWGAPNPLGGANTPWGSQPRLNTTGLTAYALNGFTPQVPYEAEQHNEWLRRVQTWSAWVAAGTSSPLADTHVVETDSFGQIQAVAFTATTGFQNSGSTPAALLMGAFVPDGETITLELAADIVGGVGSACTVQTSNAATFDALSTAGIVKSGNLQFYDRAIGSFGTGLVWDGGGFGLFDAGAARRWAVPLESYVETPAPTTDVIDDTGAEMTITLAEDEVITIEMASEMTSNGVGTRVNFQLTVDAVIVGTAGQRYIGASGIYVDASKVAKFTAPSAASYEIKARYGAAAGTTSARNVMLTVKRSLA